jgi:hypothetical protein
MPLRNPKKYLYDIVETKISVLQAEAKELLQEL